MVAEISTKNYQIFRIESGDLIAEFFSLGARITKLIYRGKDILLGYDTPEEYENDGVFCGCTVGRFAGRIREGRFVLNGKTVFLHQNEHNSTCHHGGFFGFDKQNWKGSVIDENTVSFSYRSSAFCGGFPGNMDVSVIYRVKNSKLSITIQAVSDEDTVFNPTNHAYFNPDGFDGEDCRNLYLKIASSYYLPTDSLTLPTGEIATVQNSDFDFEELRRIDEELDHFFILDNSEGIRYGATLLSNQSGICIDIFTDMPGLQIYTCNAFEAPSGKAKIPLHLHQGVAIEAQGYPDSPNHANFHPSILKANEKYEKTIIFALSCK